jgi:Polyketide cyclase / dehydrase and lipid transport
MPTMTAKIDIKATPGEILAVIADVSAYPQWSAVHKWTTIDSTFPDGRPWRATMGVSAAGLTDTVVVDYAWTAHGVSWALVRPTRQQKDQRGSYSIVDGGDVSHLQCQLTIDPAVPLPGIMVRAIMKRAIRAGTDGLKQRVESRH